MRSSSFICSLTALCFMVIGCGDDDAAPTPDAGPADLGTADLGTGDLGAGDSGSANCWDVGGTCTPGGVCGRLDESVTASCDFLPSGGGCCQPSTDGTTLLSSVDEEVGHLGDGVPCGDPSFVASTPSPHTVQVAMRNVSVYDVPGPCSPHGARARVRGSTLLVDLTGDYSSTCWSVCWDFTLTVTDVPSGTYSVELGHGTLTTTVDVP